MTFTIRPTGRDRMLRALLAVAALASIGMPIAGCGDEDGERSAPLGERSGSDEAKSEYEQILLEFHAAAAAGETFDAYGYAEYMPKTQRAAIDAFCFVADRTLEGGRFERLEDEADLVARITRKAEADLKSELDIVAPGPARRAIAKLRAVIGLGSLDRDLAERYVKACY